MTEVNAERSQNHNQFHIVMTHFIHYTMYYVGEIILLFILIFTTYASLHKGPLRVELQPAPVPFFHENSTVSDFYLGDITTPFSAIMESDVSLVMYYAPWDFDSQMTKKHFEDIADLFSNQIYFAAVNCWYPHGDCRKTFPQIRSYPLILAYVQGNRGIQYRGPLQYQYIKHFVGNLLNPLDRIETLHNLYQLQTRYSAIVTGYFNFTDPKPQGFHSFYTASLRFLELDVYKNVAFAIITNPTAASRLGITENKSWDVRLHLWNETLIFRNNGSTLDIDRFVHWVYYRYQHPINWISPGGRKSKLIQNLIYDGKHPSLLLFTPRLGNPVPFLAVKQIAMEYNNCGVTTRIAMLIEEIQRQHTALEAARLQLEQKCGLFDYGRYCNWRNNTSLLALAKTYSQAEETSCSNLYRRDLLVETVKGLKCLTNRTMKFYAMDSDLYKSFALRLGYSTTQYGSNPNVVYIINPEDESHFLLDGPVTQENLASFVLNFTSNNLVRYRRNRIEKSQCATDRICVQEVSAPHVKAVVLDHTKDIMVFYRKANCIFCDIGAKVFLKVFHMLNQQHSSHIELPITGLPEIKFVTINAEDNDLPWHFTVDRYPTIIFYPAFRKMNSRVFPPDLELNVINLMNFTISHLSVKNRVSLFLRSCHNIVCLREAQRQITMKTATISKRLRWLKSHLHQNRNTAFCVSLLMEVKYWQRENHFYHLMKYAILDTLAFYNENNVNNMYLTGIKDLDR